MGSDSDSRHARETQVLEFFWREEEQNLHNVKVRKAKEKESLTKTGGVSLKKEYFKNYRFMRKVQRNQRMLDLEVTLYFF